MQAITNDTSFIIEKQFETTQSIESTNNIVPLDELGLQILMIPYPAAHPSEQELKYRTAVKNTILCVMHKSFDCNFYSFLSQKANKPKKQKQIDQIIASIDNMLHCAMYPGQISQINAKETSMRLRTIIKQTLAKASTIKKGNVYVNEQLQTLSKSTTKEIVNVLSNFIQ